MSDPNPQDVPRLAAKVRSRSVADDSGCWNWQGAKNQKGYGRIADSASKRTYATHRVAFLATGRPIPAGYWIDHLCRNPSCCNPDHLEAVTPRENTLRGTAGQKQKLAKQAITHCPHGHEYTAANTYVCKRGRRACRQCQLARGARERAHRPMTEKSMIQRRYHASKRTAAHAPAN